MAPALIESIQWEGSTIHFYLSLFSTKLISGEVHLNYVLFDLIHATLQVFLYFRFQFRHVFFGYNGYSCRLLVVVLEHFSNSIQGFFCTDYK